MSGTERVDDRPGEHAGWTSAVMVCVGLLHFLLPAQLAALGAPDVVAAIIVVLAVVLFAAHASAGNIRLEHRNWKLWIAALVLLGGVIVTNFVSLVLLVRSIVVHGDLSATNLLLGGTVVWLTNVAAFGFVYWECDRQGPVQRFNARSATAEEKVRSAALYFPQMGDDDLKKGFRPYFVDYLYVSLTNSIAFSPTDTMPLSRWCKGLFTVQSLISFVTVALVAARAVNVLPS